MGAGRWRRRGSHGHAGEQRQVGGAGETRADGRQRRAVRRDVVVGLESGCFSCWRGRVAWRQVCGVRVFRRCARVRCAAWLPLPAAQHLQHGVHARTLVRSGVACETDIAARRMSHASARLGLSRLSRPLESLTKPHATALGTTAPHCVHSRDVLRPQCDRGTGHTYGRAQRPRRAADQAFAALPHCVPCAVLCCAVQRLRLELRDCRRGKGRMQRRRRPPPAAAASSLNRSRPRSEAAAWLRQAASCSRHRPPDPAADGRRR